VWKGIERRDPSRKKSLRLGQPKESTFKSAESDHFQIGPCTCWTPTRSERKKRWIRRQIRALPARTALLVQDETELLLLLLPPLRAGWALRGQPAPVPLSGQNARRALFGSLHLRTGHALFLARTA
jgi:hypothetical protein